MFETTSDTEVLGALIAQTEADTLEQALAEALPRVEGAYCLVFLTKDSLVAARDPLGIRPLCLGRFGDIDAPGGTGYVMASETCALDVVGATFICEIEPGEIVTVDASGMRSTKIQRTAAHRAMCSFEFIYFARPDSVMMGKSLYESRRHMGRELAREAPADGDIVITLPDSGTPAAIGYAEQAGLPFAEGHDQVALHHAHVHPADTASARGGHPPEVQPDAPRARGPPRGARRRLDRARHDVAPHHRRAAPRRSERGAHAHRVAADRMAVLHGHRHRVATRAHRRRPHRARDRRRCSARIRFAISASPACAARWGNPTATASALRASPARTRSTFPAQLEMDKLALEIPVAVSS